MINSWEYAHHGLDLLGRSIGTRATITDVFFGIHSSGLYAKITQIEL
jgi:hypothetical protein